MAAVLIPRKAGTEEVTERGRTVRVGVFQDGHGHHDSWRRRVEGAGGPRLLQRRDGAAVLRGNVGVWAGSHGTHHALQSLSCNNTIIITVDFFYFKKKTSRSTIIQTITWITKAGSQASSPSTHICFLYGFSIHIPQAYLLPSIFQYENQTAIKKKICLFFLFFWVTTSLTPFFIATFSSLRGETFQVQALASIIIQSAHLISHVM